MKTHNRAPASSERIYKSPQESRAQLGAIMIGGFEDGQKAQIKDIFATKLEYDPVLEVNEVRVSEGIFNVTPLDIDGVTYLLGRKVEAAAPWGQPDVGPLVMSELDANRNIVSTTEILNPSSSGFSLEDPRARQTSKGTIIGVTAVSEEAGRVKAYPALIKLGTPKELLSGPFPQVRIIDKFGGGSQTAPIEGLVEGKNSTSIDETNLIYRPEGMNHTLQVLDVANDRAAHVGFIDIPTDIPWALYKIGTTTPPEPLNDQPGLNDNVREFFFKFHGLNKTIDGEIVDPDTESDDVVYRYSIGTARLLRWTGVDSDGKEKVSFSVDNISREPIITPESFPVLTDGRQKELHPDKRQAVYLCGSVPTRNTAGELVREELFPNEGDMRTHNAELDVGYIVANWDRTIPSELPQSLTANNRGIIF